MGQKKINIDDSTERERERKSPRKVRKGQVKIKNEEKLKAYHHEAAFERAF